MESNITLGSAIRRVDDRRRQIEALVLADLETHLLLDPAPSGDLDSVVHDPSDLDPGDDCTTANGSTWRVVTWEE